MLVGTDFVKAQHEYRHEVLKKSYQAHPTTRIGKAVAALVVAGVTALVTFGF